MEWIWRGEHFASTSSEYAAIKAQLQVETFAPLHPGERRALGTIFRMKNSKRRKRHA